MSPRKCLAKTKSGKPCKAMPLEDSDYCFAHEPMLAEKRARWRSEGGKRSGKKALLAEAARVQSPEQVKELLARTVEGLQRGDVDPRTANAVGYLCNLLLKAIKETDTARRLEELEAAVRGGRH
jgi:hypothetical protein